MPPAVPPAAPAVPLALTPAALPAGPPDVPVGAGPPDVSVGAGPPDVPVGAGPRGVPVGAGSPGVSAGAGRRAPRRWRSSSVLAVGGLGGMLLLAGCTGVDEPRYGMPVPATTQAKQTLYLWQGVFVTALVVLAIVWGLILWSIIRYRRRGNETSLPRQTQYHIPLEITYTIVPVIVVSVIFFFVVHAENIIDRTSTTPAVSVRVEGFQWGWRFTYLDRSGTDMAPSIVGDQYSEPVLTLPAGETVRLQLVSDDVIHSFYVPDFLFKRDLIPRVNNVVELYIDKTGTFQGHCAEFCGLHHADMNFLVKAVPKDQFSVPGAAS